jgi:hypothetical protein
MTVDEPKISQGGLEAVENLLLAAKLHGIGVTIEPDSLGWKVGYILPSGGGELSAAYDLETAVRAAERPFNELAEWLRGRRDESHYRAGDEAEDEEETEAVDEAEDDEADTEVADDAVVVLHQRAQAKAAAQGGDSHGEDEGSQDS